MAGAREIFTLGHGLMPAETLLRNLAGYGIEVVVDVRSEPYSRRAPQFNQRHLERSLLQQEIGYEWWGHALGGRPSRLLHTASGAPDYEQMVRAPATMAALDQLTAMTADSRIALLCSESRPEGCHRSRMLEPELEARDVAVRHILPTGELLLQPTIFG